MKERFQKLWPHLLAVALLAACAAVYFFPAFSGYQLKQSDLTNFKGMSQEINEFRRVYGEEPLWTNAMFAGMPAYQISVRYANDVLGVVDQVVSLGLPRPAKYLFLYFLGFYLLMVAIGARPPLAAVAALAFGLSSYFIIILEAGHNSKAHAIGYMAPVLAGVVWAYRGQWLAGGAVTALFLALQIHANHIQITYYFGILVGLFILAKLVEAFREGSLPAFGRATLILGLAAVLALASNANNLYNTYAYSKYTTRGPSELTIGPDGNSNAGDKTAGLDRSYVTQWSYGLGETFSFLVPNVYGGPSGLIGNDNAAMKDIPKSLQPNIAQSNAYWGDQPFTSGPVYMGALVAWLFLLGAFMVRGPVKWALVATAILTTALSWGSNFMGLTDFFLDYVPGYNKFRAVTIILSVTELVFPLLGFIFLKRWLDETTDPSASLKPFLWVTGGVLTLLALMMLLPQTLFNFLSSQEREMLNGQMSGPNASQVLEYAEGLKAARASLLKADALRSFLIVALGAGLLWFFAKRKLKGSLVIGGLAVLVFVDLWFVDKRYVSNEKERGKYLQWEALADAPVAYEAGEADQFILEREMSRNPRVADAINKAVAEYRAEEKEKKSPKVADALTNDVRFGALRFATNYRVLPLSGTFQDARTAYFHKSVGGYHGAKLKRIQELYDFYIGDEINTLTEVFRNQPTLEGLNRAMAQASVLNMLNTEYIIYNPQAPPLVNPANLGSAWFVEDVVMAGSADEEIITLGTIDPAYEAVVDQRFADQVTGIQARDTIDGAIAVLEHLPNYIKYATESPTEQVAVFSEIYYDDGWNAYIDGQPANYFRANYALRAMRVPEGEHIIEFKFEPEGVAKASLLSTASEILVLIFLALAAVVSLRKAENKPVEENSGSA